MPLGNLKGICPLVSGLAVVLFGILNGMDPFGPGVVFVNLYGTCPVVPLGVITVGVKPEDGRGVGDSGLDGVGDVAICVTDGGVGVGDGGIDVGDGGVGAGAGGVGDGEGGIGDGDGWVGAGDGGVGDGDGGLDVGEGEGSVDVVVLFFLHLQNFFSGLGGAGLYGGIVGSSGAGPVIGGGLSGIKTGSSNEKVIGTGSSPPIKTGSSPPIKTGSSPPIRTGSSHKGIEIGSSP